MFPMGIRIWDQNRMIYPVKFSVYLDLEKNISSIKTLIEGKKYQTFNYMMLTTGIAINGYIYEKDIIMIDGEEDRVGIVEFDRMAGAFVVKVKDEIFTVNGAMEFCEVLGNVYEDAYLLDMYSLTFSDEIFYDNFNDNDDFEIEDHVIESESKIVIKKEIIETKEMNEEVIPSNNDIEIISENTAEVISVVEEIQTKIEELPIIEEIVEEINSEIVPEDISEIKDDIIKEENIPRIKEKDIENISEIVEINTDEILEQKSEFIETITEEPTIIDEKNTVETSDNVENVEIIEITEIDEESIDGNLFMGAEDLVFLDDSDLEAPLDEPIDETIIPDGDLLAEIENIPEELPPDDIFGDGTKVEITTPIIKEEYITAEEVIIYSIGYCAVDNGPGTYSYIINADGKEIKKISAGLDSTILNRIQLIGVIEALKNIKECDSIKVYCDSKYVISPFIKGWIYKWQANDWKKDSDNKVLNCDLWEEIFNLTENFSVQWEFVKDINNMKETKECLENAKKEIEKFIK